jgi:hypothetical protein
LEEYKRLNLTTNAKETVYSTVQLKKANQSEMELKTVQDLMRALNFFNLPNPSGNTKPWGLLSL